MSKAGARSGPRVAIVGAGLSGLAAARRLAEAGIASTLFDKSRGVGGRIATRRIGDIEFDHGAQYYRARGPRFAQLVEAWRAAGLVGEWFDGGFVGAPRMTAPPRALAAGHEVILNRPVTGLSRSAAGWSVHDADGPIEATGNGAFAAVLIATPAPQAQPLAASAGVTFEALERVVYAPCWSLMLAFAEPVAMADRISPEGGAAVWIARNASKPGRGPAETVVLHATPQWTRDNLERDAEAVVADLTAAFAAETGVTARPELATAHRWRYALVEQTAGQPCLWDAEARIGACGDWALGPRVESAFDSGEALAAAVIASLEPAHARAG